MKKLIISGLLAIGFRSGHVCADALIELHSRLNKIQTFYSNFLQKVTKCDGTLIQQSEGQLWIKRPNAFRWHAVSPDESWLVSDGINVWFYNPFVEQVTITLLNQVSMHTPLMLIIRNSLHDWKRYKIRKNNNNFFLIEREHQENMKYFVITIQPDGTIQQLSEVEKDGNTSIYQLDNQKHSHINVSKFTFIPPRGIAIDDQR